MIKYPRTYHLEWSPGKTNDDKVLYDLSSFIGENITISEKMDGENTSFSKDYYHARSLDSADHPSRHWVKGLWGKIKYNIPDNWRICGENLFAKHSIHYKNLKSYFMVFSIWDENNYCLSVNETLDWCELLDLYHVPILYHGKFDIEKIKELHIDIENKEGFVIRLSKRFHFDDFHKSVVKWVREDHVETDEHWMHKAIIKNKLK